MCVVNNQRKFNFSLIFQPSIGLSFNRLFLICHLTLKFQHTSLSQHQIYTAFNEYGSIVSFGVENCIQRITFEKSDATDSLKKQRTIRIGNELLIPKWTNDYHFTYLHRINSAIVPDSKSPQNMLNVLNDDCLRAIFRKLREFDSCAVGRVCHRFQDVLLSVIPKHIQITEEICNPLWKLDEYLRTFGECIKTANIITSECSDITVGFLSKYCKNLIELNATTKFESTMIKAY